MPSPLEFLQQEYNGLNEDWRTSMDERKGNLAEMSGLIRNSEVAKMTPEAAGMWGSLGNIWTQKGAINGMMEARQNQAAIRDKAALGAMPLQDQMFADNSKQFSDLQRAVLGRLASKETDMNNRYYMAGNTADGLVLVDKGTGDTKLMTIPSRFSAELPKLQEKWQKVLIEGGMTDTEQIKNEAIKNSMKEISQMMGIHQFGNVKEEGFQSPIRIPGSAPALERPPVDEELNSAMSAEAGAPSTPVLPTALPSATRESSIKKPISELPTDSNDTTVDWTTKQLVKIDSELAKPNLNKVQRDDLLGERANLLKGKPREESMVWDPVKNAYVRKGSDTTAQPTTSSSLLKSAQQKETEGVLGKNYADQYVEDQNTFAEIKKMEMSRQTMAQIVQSGKGNFGPAHEFLNKAGGYLAYIDPTASLAQYSNNDALYFSKMMDLTREKIKALGSGTAVSNLDLIVTQKSVGDMRNTRDGNAKLLAIMELQNATMMAKLGNKMSYFENNNKSYDKYKGDPSPSHIVRASVVDGQRHYWVQSKKGWIDERIKNGDYKSIEQASNAFDNASIKATAALIKGTGISMGGGN